MTNPNLIPNDTTAIRDSVKFTVLSPVWEQNLAHDSYFYQSFWCVESNKVESLMVGTTAFGGGINELPVDALPEVLQAVEVSRLVSKHSLRFQGLDHAFAFGVNAICVIKKGRKFPIGTRVQIAGEAREDSFGTRKVLVRFIDTGSLDLVAVANLAHECKTFAEYLDCQGLSLTYVSEVYARAEGAVKIART